MAECNCTRCNAPWEGADWKPVVDALEPEPPTTIYDRLEKVIHELKRHTDITPALLEELNEIHEELDNLDTDLANIRAKIYKRPVESTDFELGQLSQRLY